MARHGCQATSRPRTFHLQVSNRKHTTKQTRLKTNTNANCKKRLERFVDAVGSIQDSTHDQFVHIKYSRVSKVKDQGVTEWISSLRQPLSVSE
jgi:hypothetical protein